MSEAALNTDAPLSPEATASLAPGAQLAAARESCGLSVADVAHQLKLSPRQVEALESGDYRSLPGNVFVRGFVRNYARLVKLDAAQLLVQAEPASPQTLVPEPQVSRLADIPLPGARNTNWRKFAVAAAVLVMLLALAEFYRSDTPEPDVKSTAVESPPPHLVAEGSTATNDVTGGAPSPLSATDASVAPTTPQAVLLAQEAPPPADGGSVRGEQVVRLRFTRDSWVEIRDRNGRKIFSQLNPRGTEQVVSGLAPLTLVVGNAHGVQLTHNDHPVDLGPHTQVDVARLTLE